MPKKTCQQLCYHKDGTPRIINPPQGQLDCSVLKEVGCSQTDVREMAAAFFCGKGKDYEDSNCFKAVSDAETECIKLARKHKWTPEEEEACYHKHFKKATDEQPQPLSQGYHDLLDFWENRCCEKETVETKCKSYNPEGKCEIYEYVDPHLS